MRALDAALDQSEHHRPRRPAGAEHQRLLQAVPSWRAGIEIIDKAFDVGVGRAQLAALVPQRIGGADRAGARVRHRQRQRTLLVREGDIGADETLRRQMQHEFGKTLGRYCLDIVAALDLERPQPVMMDQRRTRMCRRPSDQARCAGSGHGSPSPPVMTSWSGSRRLLNLSALPAMTINLSYARACQECADRVVAATIALRASAAPAANQIAARLIQR